MECYTPRRPEWERKRVCAYATMMLGAMLGAEKDGLRAPALEHRSFHVLTTFLPVHVVVQHSCGHVAATIAVQKLCMRVDKILKFRGLPTWRGGMAL